MKRSQISVIFLLPHSYDITGVDDKQQQPLKKTIKSRMMVLDIRSRNDYKMGALPESVNVAFNDNSSGGGDDPAAALSAFAMTVEQRLPKDKVKKKVICVAGSASQTEAGVVSKCAEILVTEMNYARVCVLHNGIDVFKTLPGILFVPNA